ncbi:hypothetical protein SLEP1_g10320 [Rubroshorea leprosula]|uniref:Uncharacterized protein n=1 Tax=Rubroshorea leprosula TaxID=152421 RepID=A0AAV5IDG2_9ROSI|nr:hypothetical protein SLEP1_g10320 [Rubroshorea leprosula]
MISTASSPKGKKNVCQGCSLRKEEKSEHASNAVH